jgi:vitamin K-dependent gamma-carboxylase
VVGFLLVRRTRPFAYAVVIAFHLITRALFPIGMFPFIMMASALVFFPPDWPRRLLRLAPAATPSAPFAVPRVALIAAASWALVQVLVPLRTHLHGGNVLWHEQGMRFSWRVMCREKNASVTYHVEDLDSGRRWEVPAHRLLTDRQLREFGTQPDLVLQLAHHVAKQARERGHARVRVTADALASLNGRRGAPLVDPTVDLSAERDGLHTFSWVTSAPPGPPRKLAPVSWHAEAPH